MVVLLRVAEQDKGTALTEQEVLAIRDEATCVPVTASMAARMAEGRGFDDLDPEACWEQWQVLRLQFDAE
ncbi:hypothetical protein [Kytococcus sp. Marseille-QA3725]